MTFVTVAPKDVNALLASAIEEWTPEEMELMDDHFNFMDLEFWEVD